MLNIRTLLRLEKRTAQLRDLYSLASAPVHRAQRRHPKCNLCDLPIEPRQSFYDRGTRKGHEDCVDRAVEALLVGGVL
jgi:hypothetical protein